MRTRGGDAMAPPGPDAPAAGAGGAQVGTAAAEEEPRARAPPANRAAAAPVNVQPPVKVEPERTIREYFRVRGLPWWLCFLVGIFLLAKLQIVYNDSPCAVLGTHSPVTMGDVKKAFRTLSMCTHPDRLRGRLKRNPSSAESRRGEIIFNRASAARDELQKMLKRTRETSVECYKGELEFALLTVLTQAGKYIGNLGLNDYYTGITDSLWTLVTFENGFFNTILSALWILFLIRMVKQFLLYLWRMGILKGTVALVTTVIIGPIPTVLEFIFLPLMRLWVFVQETLEGLRQAESLDGGARETHAPDAGDKKDDKPVAEQKQQASTASRPVAQEEDHPRGLRQRKKRETDEDREKKKQELLSGEPTQRVAPAEAAQDIHPVAMPDSLMDKIRWCHPKPLKAREAAAAAVQFDMLLILTKPIIPLFMLIAVGQVWNGLISSLIIGHALRRWVPQMSFEAHHVLCAVFGTLHTLLGVSASQVEDYANREGQGVLHLTWNWWFKDILAVMHMCLLGATVTAAAAMGNEPNFAATFASGIALRITFGQDSVRSFPLFKSLASSAEGGMRSLGVVFDAAEEVVAYSGHGIGDCGGGPFRMMLGDGPAATWAATALKTWLMVLPAVATAHWLQRTWRAGRLLVDRRRRRVGRFIQRLILALMGLNQCRLLIGLELNASNGALGNFWVAMLFGCAGESLLSTYDVRSNGGTVRHLLVLALFIFI